MRIRYWFLLICFFILVAWIGETLKPQKLDWRPTFDIYHKIPYGTYILFQELPDLFPGSTVELLNTLIVEQNFRTKFGTAISEDSMRNYLYINNELPFTERETKNLLEIAGRGNDIFISSNLIPDKLLEELDLEINTEFDDSVLPISEDTLYVCSGTTGQFISSAMKNKFSKQYFDKYNSDISEELGMNSSGHTNFLSIDYEPGRFFIHLDPEIFTNYNFIKYDNLNYVNEVFGYVPNRFTYYDYEYVKPDKIDGLLEIAKANDSMNLLLYFLLIISILYFLFTGKRKQNSIPILKPHTNQTRSFVETVGALYQSYNDPGEIARNKIKYLNELIFDRYHINLIADKKGDHSKLKEMFDLNDKSYQTFLNYCKLPFEKTSFSYRDLLMLNKKIEEYKITFRL